MAAARIDERYLELCERHGITVEQLKLLQALRAMGRGGCSRTAIAAHCPGRSPDLSRLFDRLEARGLITRERDPADRRVVICRISVAGATLLENLDPSVHAVHDGVLASLTREERTQLARLARLLAASGSD